MVIRDIPKVTYVTSVKTIDILDQHLSTDVEIKSPSLTLSVENDTIQEAFRASKSRWVDDPVISQWRSAEHKIHGVLSELNDLYNAWKPVELAPFALSPDPLWLDTGRALASVGLPWFTNQLNLPDEIDTSWPFHFKDMETQVLQSKGARVGDPYPKGYVTNYDEANLYCIRALQQELREQCPTHKPILVYDHFDHELMVSAGKILGLEICRVSLSHSMESIVQHLHAVRHTGTGPIIFAATLYSSSAEYDDLRAISQLAEAFPLILHVDAFRSFDYITDFPPSGHSPHGRVKVRLAPRNIKQPLRADDQSILASTIVAGGLTFSRHDPAIALKPASVGAQARRVAYIRSFDSTLSGSRDGIAPLWLGLYESRLGERGSRELTQYLELLRNFVLHILKHQNISATTSPYSADIVVHDCTDIQETWMLGLGGTLTSKGDIILSINPRISVNGIRSFLKSELPQLCVSCPDNTVPPRLKDLISRYPISQNTLNEVQAKVEAWQVMTRTIVGYPLHMGSYSALGPVIGKFYDINIPKDWVEKKSQDIITSRMQAFGLTSTKSRKNFKGAFTNGSTMGNRLGIITALENFPNAFVYFSSETHYSVLKTASDCDDITNRWAGRGARYAQIRCADNGSILIEDLVQQALTDRERCVKDGVEYHMILFINMGTTFIGGRDDLEGIYEALKRVGIQISYIHIDGALEFGFETCGKSLGPPGALNSDGTPMVQGITISHHKALGNITSGEVICFSPGNQLPTICLSTMDPRAVFETWLYSQIYSPTDLETMFDYCQENASLLQSSLGSIGMANKRNKDSIIAVLERPPSWILEEFALRPEGDWVHFITMPHISKETIQCFVDELQHVDKQFSFGFSCATPLLSDCLGKSVRMQRVGCCSILAERVLKLTQVLCQQDNTVSPLSVRYKLRGALSVVAVDEIDDIQVVFLVGSTRDRSIHVGAVFIKTEFIHREREIVGISKLLVGLLARHLKAKVIVDGSSYKIHRF